MNSSKLSALGITVLRVAVGIIFAAHGSQKVFVYGLHGTAQAFAQMGLPVAGVLGPLVALLEFFGGIALILGLFTRLAAFGLAVNMVGAVVAVHLKNGFFLPTGFEYAFAMLATNASLVLTGAGALAVDNVMGDSKTTAKFEKQAA